jgi:tyrosyl-tRNA synthetase
MQETFLTEFQKKGYFHQCTNESELNDLMSKGKIKAYIGFDCTAPSLHVGNLMQIMCLRLLQKYGHQPIVLLGGGTTLIGDPSGKDETRKILDKKEINKNIKQIKNIFNIFLKTKNPKTKPIFVNNYSWLSKLNYINFLRGIGKHFTINKMLTFDSVKLRLEREQSLSYMEFNYMMLQAYDFYELNKRFKCSLQIGGSDQWGNIVNGTDLIKRKNKIQTHGLTTPLITTSSGSKMGKTEKGAVWLNKKMLSAYEYWQFWRNTDDKDVIRFLKLFTDLTLNKINELENSNLDINKLKILLANETTSLLHGVKEAKDSELTAKKTFNEKSFGKDLPTIKIDRSEIKNGIKILDLILKTNLINSKSEIRRMIKNKGLKINNEVVIDERKIIYEDDLDKNGNLKISHGKKKHVLIKVI